MTSAWFPIFSLHKEFKAIRNTLIYMINMNRGEQWFKVIISIDDCLSTLVCHEKKISRSNTLLIEFECHTNDINL